MPGYQLVKSACTATMQQIARDTPAEKMQMLSFHPSTVFTEAAKMAGYTEDTLPWVDGMYSSRSCYTSSGTET